MGIRDRIEMAFEWWGHAVCRFRWTTIAAMALLTVAMGSGTSRLTFEMSTISYLDPSDPARIAYNQFRNQFEHDDSILLVLHSEQVFSFAFLEKLKRLHEDLEEEIPLLNDVKSLINARVTRGSQDELIVEELLENWPQSPAELEAVAARARSYPVYTNTLLSEDARYTTVTIALTPGADDATEQDALRGFDDESLAPGEGAASGMELPPMLHGEELNSVMESLISVVRRHKSDDFPIYITGNPELSYSLAQLSRSEMTFFGGLTDLLIALLLLVFFRRLSGVILPVLVVTLPLVATLGIMGFVGLPITPSTQTLPSLLIAVCVGDAVHILAIFYRKFDRGSSKEESISHALGHSGLAVLMTSLTTAGGLGSFAFADLVPVAGLGVAAPTGVMLALVYSVVLLPALVAVLPIRPRRSPGPESGPSPIDRLLASIGVFCTGRPWLVVTCWSTLLAAAIFGAAQLRIGHRPLEWFPENYPTRVAAEVANQEMKGIMPLEILVDSGKENGLHVPEMLNRIERIQEFVRSVETTDTVVGQTISLVDIVKETHRALNENDPEFYVIPQDRELVAQEMLLFESSGSDDLEKLVDRQFRKARINLLASYEDGIQYVSFVQEVERGAREIAGDLAEVETTGLIKLWVRTISAMLTSTAKSYAVALLVIVPLMILLIGELRMGLLCLIPNLSPIIMGMGMMYWLGIPFDMFTMMIGSITIGMAVDCTIHFMHGFLRYYTRGADAPAAVRETLLTTGRALVVTSVALSTGFFVQMFGTMISVRNCGFIAGFTIMVALIADIVLAPALVTLAARFEQRRRNKESIPPGKVLD